MKINKFQAVVSGAGYGFVYILSYPGDDKLKIGHSLDPFNRAKDIGGTKAPEVPIVEAVFWCSERREDVERASHRLESGRRHNGEWFDISMERAFDVIQQAAQKAQVEIQIIFDKRETSKTLKEKAVYEKHLAALKPKCMNYGFPLPQNFDNFSKWIRCKKCDYEQIQR